MIVYNSIMMMENQQHGDFIRLKTDLTQYKKLLHTTHTRIK